MRARQTYDRYASLTWLISVITMVILSIQGASRRFTAFVADITERKRAGETLRASEQRLRAILDSALDAVVSMNEQGVITDWNPQAEAIFGWSRGEAIGQSLAETIIPPHYREQHRRGMKHYLATGEGPLLNRRIEITALRRDGTEFPVELTVSHSMQGDSRRFTAFVADITERKRAEAALRENETQMRLFMEATADCIWNWDLTAASITRNAGFERLFGYATDEIDPTIDWWTERLHPDDRERVIATYREAVASGRTTCSYEYRFLRRDGSYAIVTDHAFIVRDATGKVVRAIGAMTDITERKQAEEALRESERRFRTIFDQAPIGMAVMNSASGQFRRINRKFCEIVGYSHKEMLTRTFHDITHPDDLQADLDNMTRMMEGRIHHFQMEKRYIRKDGAVVWVNLMCVPLWWDHEKDGRFHIAMVKDITERKRAEEGLRQRSRQQAIEAELSLLAATVPDLSSLLSTVTKLTSNALEVDYCEVLELLPNGSELRLCASAGWKDDRIGQVWAAETGSLAHAVLQSNKPVIRVFRDNTRFGGPPWLHQHGAVDGMHVSIPGKESPWGVLGVYAAGGRTFPRDDVNFLQTISSILATAIERMQTEAVLRSTNQTLRTLSRQLLQVQEEDRRTIARDLHDEIGQSLTAIKLNVERAQRTSDRAARERIMKDCIQTTDSVLNQVRNLSLDLHPSILDDLGLSYALKWYADRQAERAGLKVDVTADPSGPRLPQDVEIACFRIAQEALTNVVRHAQASRAIITLKRLSKRVELRIQDDGIGFDVKTVQSPMGSGASIGLTGMRERARLVGGEVHVQSVLKKGTEVTAIMPLPSVPSAGTTSQAPPP
jgi:PAS domain S-box-containing protein